MRRKSKQLPQRIQADERATVSLTLANRQHDPSALAACHVRINPCADASRANASSEREHRPSLLFGVPFAHQGVLHGECA